MADVINVKRDDTGPPVVVAVLNGSEVQSLVGATTVKWLMGTLDANLTATTKVARNMTIVDADSGTCTIDWEDGDLDTAGAYKAEVEVTWSSGLKQTFPAAGYITVNILADLG